MAVLKMCCSLSRGSAIALPMKEFYSEQLPFCLLSSRGQWFAAEWICCQWETVHKLLFKGNFVQVVKKLACGDVGEGAMAHVDDIVRAVQQAIDDTKSSWRA